MYLKAGGLLSFVAALLHVLIIMGGPAWYRFFGAGEEMARMAEDGSSYPIFVTAAIALTLTIWGLYALSGAGIIRRLPFLKPVLVIISIILLLRGILGVPLALTIDHPYLNELAEKLIFMILSSVISLSMGLLYFQGLRQMSRKPMD